MTADNKDTTLFIFKLVLVLAALGFLGWGLSALFKRAGSGLKEGGEALGYGKTEDSVPQGDWLAPDGTPLSANQVGAKGWADLLNLPAAYNPLNDAFLVDSNHLPSSSLMQSVSDQIYKLMNEFWHVPFITHQGDDILNLLQQQPTTTYIHEIASGYKAVHNSELLDDLQTALTDTMKDALAKILMTKQL